MENKIITSFRLNADKKGYHAVDNNGKRFIDESDIVVDGRELCSIKCATFINNNDDADNRYSIYIFVSTRYIRRKLRYNLIYCNSNVFFAIKSFVQSQIGHETNF